MTILMEPVVDPDNGFMMYPVRHALGAIVFSFTEESQRLWQELADKQSDQLMAMAERRRKK